MFATFIAFYICRKWGGSSLCQVRKEMNHWQGFGNSSGLLEPFFCTKGQQALVLRKP